MPITLDDFRALSNGDYNAGQIDFKTNRNGEVTGLRKVNNFVHRTGKNTVAIDAKRAVQIKETFIRALEATGVDPDRIAQIRARLGISADTKTSVADAGAALRQRFQPLTRQQVREILREHVDGGGAAPAETRRVRDARARVDAQIASLVRKSPPHEQLFALLAGRSFEDSTRAALRSSPDMMKVAAALRFNAMDTEMRNAWNRGVDRCLDRAGRTIARLRVAVTAFVANPDAEPMSVKTRFGTITLSRADGGAMREPALQASIRVGNETLTIDLGGTAAEIVERLDGQISGDPLLLGRERLGAMLSYARSHGAVAEDSEPCLGRTVAQTILRTFANVGQGLLDELDNASLARYARDVAEGTTAWTEDSIRSARNDALRDPENVNTIATVAGEIGEDDAEGGREIARIISENANEAIQEVVGGGANDEPVDGNPQGPEQGPPPQGEVVPPPQGEVVQPPQEPPPQEPPPQEPPPQAPAEDKFEKLFGAPLSKDADDVTLPGRKARRAPKAFDDRLAAVAAGDGEVAAHYKSTLARASRERERRIFNDVTLTFERPKASGLAVDDRASAVKPGPLAAPKHFEAAQRTVDFTFAGANLPKADRKAIGDFALGLLHGASANDAAALKALVAANLHAFLLMAADPAGAAAFFPPEFVADAKGLVASLAQELKDAAKAGTGRDIDFRSFTQGDEDAVRAMLGRTKGAAAADAFAAAVATILRESVSVAVRVPDAQATQAAAEALGGGAAAPLAALGRGNPLELVSFASGDGRIPGRNAAQTAEIKAAVMKAFAEATGHATLAETTLAEFDAFAAKCAQGALDKTLGAIADRNRLFGGDLYDAVGGSTDKRVGAGLAQKDIGAVPKAPQNAELAKGDVVGGIRAEIVGGITLHIPDMLDSEAPHPRNATAADLRNLAADLFETAEAILAKGANASPEALRDAMLRDIDAFCRFLDNPRALADAVMPPLRELVAAAMAEVRDTLGKALEAALGRPLRNVRPVEVKQFLQAMDPAKSPDAAATLGRIAAAFAKLADGSAAQVQSYVNELCGLDPNAKIASEYDRMTPDQITDELSKKSLDDILDDPIKNSSRPGMLSFQKKVLASYFTTVSRARKAEVLSSALRNAPEAAEAGSVATRSRFLSAIFLGAGPLMQKTLQGIDRRVLGPYGAAVDVLKSSIPPIPDAYVREKLNEIVQQNGHRYSVLMTFNQKPYVLLGAATVAQAVQCRFMRLDGEPEDVIVKILRPGVKARFDEEVKIFDDVARGIPSVGKIWADRVRAIADEFDFTVEARNIQVGQVYEVYDKRLVMVKDPKTKQMVPKVDPKTQVYVLAPGTENTWTVSAMKTPPDVKQRPDLLVGSVAPGKPFDKILAEQSREIHGLFAGVFETDAEGRIVLRDGKPVVRRDMTFAGFYAIHNRIHQAVENVSASRLYFRQVIWKWLEEALFKSGVMHNDVHTGNLMLDTEEGRATFIDFGNVVQLSKDDRNALLKLVAAVAAKHTDYFVEAFGELFAKTKEGRRAYEKLSAKGGKFHSAVRQVIHKGLAAADTGYRFQALLSEIQKLGVEIPPQIAAFVEGLTRLQNCYEELASLLRDAQALYRSYLEQVLAAPRLAPRDPDDAIGQLLDVLVKPGALETARELDPTGKPLDKEIYDARNKAMDMVWEGMDGSIKGTLVTQIREAIAAEEKLPDNKRLEHLVSLVSRHAFPKDAAAIDAALAHFADVKRRLRGAESSGANRRAAELRAQLETATQKLLVALKDGAAGIQQAIDDGKEAEPPAERHFEVESAAQIFADIVDGNVAAVKQAFSLWGTGKIGVAFKRAAEDDKNHKADGHRRTTASKL